MDEQKVTEQTAAPDAAPESWEDDAILPEDESSGTEAAAPTPDEPGENPPGEETAPSGETDAPSEGDADSGAQADAKPPDAPSEKPEAPEPDWKALYEERQEKDNADKFRAVYREQLALTGNEAIARMIARNECGGKDYPLEDAPETPSAPGQADFRAALAEIQSLYPDATDMPGDVMKSFANGTPLKDAYAAFRAKQDAETIATLRRENDALKKSASNRAAAPVKGVNSAPPEKEDPFVKGFDMEW